jgi:hypothetical protein
MIWNEWIQNPKESAKHEAKRKRPEGRWGQAGMRILENMSNKRKEEHGEKTEDEELWEAKER